MSGLVLYQKQTCTTCRSVYKALVNAGVDFETVDYIVDPLPRKQLERLIKKLGMAPVKLLRKNELRYKALGLGNRKLSDSEVIDLFVRYPELLQRPIIERGQKAILARPAERLKEIL